MGRIRQMIRIQGKESWTLFDSGARNTYITPSVAEGLTTTNLPQPTHMKLEGETKTSSRTALLVGEIAGKAFHTEAMVIDHIGNDEDGNDIEVLFGALAMQQWGIRLAVAEEELDLSHYPEEFVEY
ncbi:MAG: aspartyl protease family protein [Candidatus Sumerlaeota bacterium]|nr:aspartyl protease family protein [Candidatus Sumerlaeota bacterium]